MPTALMCLEVHMWVPLRGGHARSVRVCVCVEVLEVEIIVHVRMALMCIHSSKNLVELLNVISFSHSFNR